MSVHASVRSVPDITVSAIAFDLDGTLVDSAPDIALALNSALAQAGLQGFVLPKVRSWIGDGPDLLIQRALAAQPQLGEASPALLADLRAAFDAATLAAPLQDGQVFEGVARTVARLAQRWPLVVVTNKPTLLAQAVLEAAGLRALFQRVHGADTAALRKPQPTLLQQASAALGVAPQHLLMVGDSLPDMQCARHAGCPAALVAWGYGHGLVPADLPTWHVATPDQLLEDLDRIQS